MPPAKKASHAKLARKHTRALGIRALGVGTGGRHWRSVLGTGGQTPRLPLNRSETKAPPLNRSEPRLPMATHRRLRVGQETVGIPTTSAA